MENDFLIFNHFMFFDLVRGKKSFTTPLKSYKWKKKIHLKGREIIFPPYSFFPPIFNPSAIFSPFFVPVNFRKKPNKQKLILNCIFFLENVFYEKSFVIENVLHQTKKSHGLKY